MLLKEWQKWLEDGEEDRSSYWMILGKWETTRKWQRNNCIALCELTLKEAMDLPYGRSRLYKVDSLRNLGTSATEVWERSVRKDVWSKWRQISMTEVYNVFTTRASSYNVTRVVRGVCCTNVGNHLCKKLGTVTELWHFDLIYYVTVEVV